MSRQLLLDHNYLPLVEGFITQTWNQFSTWSDVNFSRRWQITFFLARSSQVSRPSLISTWPMTNRWWCKRPSPGHTKSRTLIRKRIIRSCIFLYDFSDTAPLKSPRVGGTMAVSGATGRNTEWSCDQLENEKRKHLIRFRHVSIV